MDARVKAAVARGHGLVTTRQLRELGVDPRRVAAWVKGGKLVAVRRGVYTTRELWESWDVYRARPIARVRAVELTLGLPHVLSHDSAGLVTGVPLLRPQDADVHVSRLHLRGSMSRGGVHHHGARYSPADVVVVDGLRTLDVPRTVADLAREHGYRAGLVAADGAMQLGVSRAELEAAAAAMVGWPESLTVNAAIADADPGAESVAETLGRELLAECGLEEIETQFPVRVGGAAVWCESAGTSSRWMAGPSLVLSRMADSQTETSSSCCGTSGRASARCAQRGSGCPASTGATSGVRHASSPRSG